MFYEMLAGGLVLLRHQRPQTAALWSIFAPALTNVTFSRIYKDAEGNWKSTSSFGRDDLLVLAKVADMAHTKVFEVANGNAADQDGEQQS